MFRFYSLFFFLFLSVCSLFGQQITDTESSHAHNGEALKVIKQMLDNKIDSAAFVEASGYLFQWAAPSHDVNVMINDVIGEMQNVPNGRYYVFGYIAACCEVQLEEKSLGMNWPRFIKAMTRLTDFYCKNSSFTGKVEPLESYSKLHAKALEKRLRKDFAELIKEE